MPQYAFTCAACGPFEVWRPAAEAAAPQACPTCEAPASRVWSTPGLARTPVAMRRARDREERSAHVPEVVSTKAGRPMPGHAHGSHGHHH